MNGGAWIKIQESYYMENGRRLLILLAVGAALALCIGIYIAERKGEFHSGYYTVFLNGECEYNQHAFVKRGRHPNQIYKQYIEQIPMYSVTALNAASKLPGMSFQRVNALSFIWVHFVFGFGLFCIILGIFKRPTLAIASTFFAYAVEPISQVYAYHPWVSSMLQAILPLIFSAFGLLILKKRILSLSALALTAFFQPLWFLAVLPVYLLALFSEAIENGNDKLRFAKKLIPFLMVIYPVVLVLLINFKLEAGAAYGPAERTIFWNLAAARGNHNMFFGNLRYFLVLKYAAMLAACPLLLQLPAAKKFPALKPITQGAFYTGVGFLIVQIVGNEFKTLIAANGITPLRMESMLFFLMLFHLIAGVMDEESPRAARMFSTCMFIALALSWNVLFNFFPICMPLWAMLQARFYQTSRNHRWRNYLPAAYIAIIAVLVSYKIMPRSVVPPLDGFTVYLPFININLAIPFHHYVVFCNIILLALFLIISTIRNKRKNLSGGATAAYMSARGLYTSAFAAIVFLLGAWGLCLPHYSAYSNLKSLNAIEEVSAFIKDSPPGPDSWRRTVSWIQANVKENESILTHLDLPLYWVVDRNTNLDLTMIQIFFYAPSLLRDINQELLDVYEINAKKKLSIHGLHTDMSQAWPGARIRAYFGKSHRPAQFAWIAEPASAPRFLYRSGAKLIEVKPDFENEVVRIYKTK